MIRTREWKYLHRYPHGPHERYDLVIRPGKRVSLVRHADALRDGRVQAFTGSGQRGQAGPNGTGREGFHGMESGKKLDDIDSPRRA